MLILCISCPDEFEAATANHRVPLALALAVAVAVA